MKGKSSGMERYNNKMNMTEMPMLKPIETVSDTMKHMMTTLYNNQSIMGGSINKGAFQLLPVAERNSVIDKTPIDTNTSQTASSGFFDHLGHATLKTNVRLKQGSKLHEIAETRNSVVVSSDQKNSVIQNSINSIKVRASVFVERNKLDS